MSKPRTRAEARTEEVLAWLQQDRPVTVMPVEIGFGSVWAPAVRLATLTIQASVTTDRSVLASEETLLLP